MAGITVRLDYTAPGSGIALITGDHGFAESPQALVGRNGKAGRWYAEDSYGDLGKDGQPRADIHVRGTSAIQAVKRWAGELGLDTDAEDFRIIGERDY